jgi:hypothetical protein
MVTDRSNVTGRTTKRLRLIETATKMAAIIDSIFDLENSLLIKNIATTEAKKTADSRMSPR